jgi:hypothetical protein
MFLIVDMSQLVNILRTKGYSNNTNTPTRKIEKTIDELNALLNKTDNSDFDLKNAILTQLIDKTGMLNSTYWSNKKSEYEKQQTELNKLEFLLLTDGSTEQLRRLGPIIDRLPDFKDAQNFKNKYLGNIQEDPSGPRRSSSVASDPGNFSTSISNAEQARWNALNSAVSLGGPKGPRNYRGGSRKNKRRPKNLMRKTRSKKH